MTVKSIHPAGDGCTSCLTGDAVPLDRATANQVARMLNGHLGSRLDADTEIEITVTVTLTPRELELHAGFIEVLRNAAYQLHARVDAGFDVRIGAETFKLMD